MIRASASPASGVSGEGLSTTVLPAASALIQLHDVETVREVPWRQDRHHTQRLMPQQRCSGADPGDLLVGQLGGELGGVHGHESGAVDLHHALIGNAAPLHLGQREELVGVLHQRVAQLVETPGALLGAHRAPRPAVEGAARGRDRVADLGDARVGRGGDGLLGGRGDVVVATVLRLDPLPSM